jgi:Ser/Thr protein kinase RdoA (MazF antagonist)
VIAQPSARPPKPGWHVLVARAPELSPEWAGYCAATLFGIDPIRATRLPGNRDATFLIDAPDGRRAVLKIANLAQETHATDLYTSILLHLAGRDLGFEVPRLIPTLGGKPHDVVALRDGTCAVYAMSFVVGAPIEDDRDPSRQRARGRCLARLVAALGDLQHPASDQDYPWRVSNAPDLRSVIEEVPREMRKAVEVLLDGFEENAADALAARRRQIVHNDFSPNNILYARPHAAAPSAVIDFCDAVHDPPICDVAVAATYFMWPDDLLRGPAEFLKGYNSHTPVSAGEVALVYDLIGARLAAWTVLAYWRARLHPDLRADLLRHMAPLSDMIAAFSALGRRTARDQFEAALGERGAPW